MCTRQHFTINSDSLKLSKELKDYVSEGWAHGNLGNTLLGLDQKDEALDHLTTAYNMSSKYECNPLAVGRAVSNLGNAFHAMGSLQKAKEHYETDLGHAIICDRICEKGSSTHIQLYELGRP